MTSIRRGHGRLLATAAGLAAAGLLLSACTSSGDSPGGAAASGASDDAAAQAVAFAALPPEEQEAQLRSLSADVEAELVTLSGLDTALGGGETAQATYRAMTARLVARATQFRGTPSTFGKFGARPVPTDDGVTLGGLIFANWLLTALATDGIVSSTNDAKPGETAKDTQSDDKGGSKSTLTREGSIESASVDWAMETTEKGVTGKLRTKIVVNPCPDAQGKFTATISMTSSATTGGGRTGSNTTVDIKLDGRVDDDAKLTGYDVETRSQAAEFAGGKGTYADVTDRASHEGDKLTAFTRTVNRLGGTVKPEFASQWANLGMMTEAMISSFALKAAQKGWESGRCVQLDATTAPARRTGLKPSTSVTITAPPRSKIDGSKVGGTVLATLTGASSVDPATKTPADATFAYVAPGEKDKRASVALEARSRRGVAKALLDFDTYATTSWVIQETQGSYEFEAVSCGSEKGPWTIKYTLVGQPAIKGGGVIRITFPGDRSTPGTAPVKGTGTDKGELKAVGLPGGVRFSASTSGTLVPVDEQRYDMNLKQSGGTATGYAMGRTATAAWPGNGFTLAVKASTIYACSR